MTETAAPRHPALWAIRAYRRWLSPRKGFSCAYRVRRGGESCSNFAEARIAEAGLWRALPAIRARFHACAEAARDGDERPQGKARKKGRRDGLCVGATEDLCCASPELCGCGGGFFGRSRGGGKGDGCDLDCGCDGCNF